MSINFQNVQIRMSAGIPSQFPADNIPQIALSGRSNVGKSSLINTVLGRKNFARTSNTPGKTITINFYDVDGKFYLVDLPGYGYAKRPGEKQKAWSGLTDSYLRKENPIKLIIQFIDLKVGPTGDDCMMLDWMNANCVPYIIAATKSDKINKTTRAANLSALETHPLLNPPCSGEKIRIIPFSSLTGEGKNEIITGITEYIRM